MKIISHRGNLNGRSYLENHPEYIKEALKSYEVELDVWYVDGQLYLGHDHPVYPVAFEFFTDRMWIHCKNQEAVEFLIHHIDYLNIFWHENDKMTLTSKGIIWCFPGNYSKCGITVALEYSELPEIMEVYGVCTDFPHEYNTQKLNS